LMRKTARQFPELISSPNRASRNSEKTRGDRDGGRNFG
jgi:hypothetical protein